jgi:hypothetical protein
MSKPLDQALTAVRDWHGNHPDGGAKPKLDMSRLHFGDRVMFAGSVVIVDAYTRNNDEPPVFHIRFACDTRRTTFPVSPDDLSPLPVPRAGELIH